MIQGHVPAAEVEYGVDEIQVQGGYELSQISEFIGAAWLATCIVQLRILHCRSPSSEATGTGFTMEMARNFPRRRISSWARGSLRTSYQAGRQTRMPLSWSATWSR
jgi:hypothetical protein